MSGPRVGELFAGYGGLGMGVQAALGGEITWYSEIDKGALKILTHRFPDVPNIGDITAVDWSQVEPVDILTGGSPCQDLSHAGKRAGMTDGTRSNLWVAMREAIAQLRPGMVIWENVRGAYSAEADSELVSDARLLADTRRRDGQPVLRALGRVLGDLSELGYVGGWHGLRAADVGAPHGRMRVFVVAENTDRVGECVGSTSPLPQRGTGSTLRSHGSDRGAGNEGLTPLLPTPAVNDMGASYTPETWDEWTAKMQAAHGNGNGHGKSLTIEAQRLLPTPSGAAGGQTSRSGDRIGEPLLGGIVNLLPTPRTENNENRQSEGYGGTRGNFHGLIHGQEQWGDYAPAIARWEQILGRPAPAPTQTSSKGNPQLSPAFVEWLMGLPAGWVTDAPGITRNEALKALGNGVVPQQAEAAVRFLLTRIEAAA